MNQVMLFDPPDLLDGDLPWQTLEGRTAGTLRDIAFVRPLRFENYTSSQGSIFLVPEPDPLIAEFGALYLDSARCCWPWGFSAVKGTV